MKIESIRKYYPLFIIISLLFLFIKTTAPDVTTGDSGELLSSAYYLGIGHPPGYPLYWLLAKLFYYLSFILTPLFWLAGVKITDQFAYRVNLLSGVFTTISSFMFYYFILYLLKNLNKNKSDDAEKKDFFYEISLISSLTFGTINLIWSQSTNTEVYTLNLLFLVLNLFLITKFTFSKKIKYLRLFSFIYGLNIVAHQTSSILAPIFGLWIIYIYPKIMKKPRVIFSMFILFILGLTLYFYLPIRSAAHPPLDWGNTSNFKNFVNHILRRQYGELIKNVPKDSILQSKRSFKMFLVQNYEVLKILFKNFTLILLPLLLAGMFRVYKKNRKYFFFIIVSSIFFIEVMTYITNFKIAKLSIYVNEIFYIPAILLLYIFIPIGIEYILDRVSPTYIRYFFAVPIIMGILNYHTNDEHNNYIIAEYTENILKTLDSKAKVFTMGDNTTFPLAYYHYVKHKRPDVLFIGEYGFIFQDMFKLAKVDYDIPNNIKKKIRDKIEEKIIERDDVPIYYTYDAETKVPVGKKIQPYGIIYKLSSVSNSPKMDEYPFYSYSFDSMNDKKNYQDLMDRDMVSIVYYHLGEYFGSIGDTVSASKYSLKSKFVSGTEYAKKRIHYNLALDYKKRGQIDKAEKELLTAIEIDNNYSKAHSLLGNIYSDMGKHLLAISEFKQALKNEEDNPKTYNNIGIEFYKIGKIEEAFSFFKKAISLDKNNYEAYNNIAVILEEFKKYNEAVAMYKKAIELNPKYKDAYYNLGTLYLNANYIDLAYKSLKDAIKVYPQYADAYFNLGILFQKKRDYKKAVEYFKKAIEFKPNFAEGYFNIGVSYLWLKEYREAEKNFKTAVKIKPNYYIAYKHLGNTYYYMQDLSLAYKEWKKAYQLNPNDKELKNNLQVLESQGIQ